MTPFMGLTLPTVGITLGPLWATELNAALDLVDSHNHTTGNGALIPSAALSLNAAVPFNDNDANTLRSAQFTSQSAPLSGITDLTCLYVSQGNLFYNNSVGNQVQITLGAGLDATSVGGFGGDYSTSTASAFYTSASSTFTFWSNTNIPAKMDMGDIILHPTSSNAFGVTLKAPSALAANYTLTAPAALQAQTGHLTVDTSGNMAVSQWGLSGTVTVSYTGSGSATPIAGSSVTITTNGGPVRVALVGLAGSGQLSLGNFTGAPETAGPLITFYRAGVAIGSYAVESYINGPTGNSLTLPVTLFSHIDAPAAGTYAYTVSVQSSNVGGSDTMSGQFKLFAGEM